MRQAQGSEPSNPYRTLQLHPAAPRELIDEAYWALVERVRTTTKASSASERLLLELNTSYAVLSDADRRKEFDRTLTTAQVRPPALRLRRSGIWPLATTKFASDHADLYHLLHVDRSADTEIIALAHRVLSGQASGFGAQSAFLRRILLEAYQVLGNPARRATYDQSIGAGSLSSDAPAPGASAEAIAPLVDVKAQPTPNGAAARKPDDSSSAMEQPGECDPAAAASMPPEHLRAEPEPVPEIEVVPAAVSEAEDMTTEPVSASDAPNTHRVRTWMGALRSAALTAGIAGNEARVRVPPKKALTAEAEQRLLTLHNGHDDIGTSPAPQPHPDYGASVAGAELIFLEGTRAGARVSLGHEAVTIGSAHEADVMLSNDGGAIAPQHARIWQHGDRFVLRQIAEDGTLVDGESLALGLVMLDDGDEIQIGNHRMRFSLIR